MASYRSYSEIDNMIPECVSCRLDARGIWPSQPRDATTASPSLHVPKGKSALFFIELYGMFMKK